MVKLTDKMFKYKRLEIEINKMRGGETEKAREAFDQAGGEGVDDPALATYLQDLDAVGAKNDHADIGSAAQPISGSEDGPDDELAEAFSSLK